MKIGEKPVVDGDLDGYIKIPTVSVAGSADFAFEYSLALNNICEAGKATLIIHENGHDVPRDRKNVAKMAAAIRNLAMEVLHVW
jgi:hypothetical protein